MEVVILLVILGSFFICPVVSYMIAAGKGRDALGFALLGFLLQPIGVIVALLVSESVEVRMRKERAIQSRLDVDAEGGELRRQLTEQRLLRTRREVRPRGSAEVDESSNLYPQIPVNPEYPLGTKSSPMSRPEKVLVLVVALAVLFVVGLICLAVTGLIG